MYISNKAIKETINEAQKKEQAITIYNGETKCFIDKLIAVNSHIAFLSFYGNKSSCKSISASFFESNYIYIGENVFNDFKYYNHNGKYKVMTQENQKMIYFKPFFETNKLLESKNVFLLFGDTEKDALQQAFHLINQNSSVPIAEEWQDLLFSYLLTNGYIKEGFYYSSKGDEKRVFSLTIPTNIFLENFVFNEMLEGKGKDEEEKKESLDDFLLKHRQDLYSKIDKLASPIYKKGETINPKIEKRLEKSLRVPFFGQREAILSLTKGFTEADKKALFLVGTMGTGKTLISLLTSYLVLPENSRTLVLCPSHLVSKWKDEIRKTIPNPIIIDGSKKGLDDLFKLKKEQKKQGRVFYIINKERARNHYQEKSAFLEDKTGRIKCPNCLKVLEKFVKKSFKHKNKSNSKCPFCKEPLWEASNKYRRFSKAKFIQKMPKGFFDLLIADEVHQYKSGDSSQGQAFAILSSKAKRTLCLTGTLMGGYSTNLFYLLYRTIPKKLKNISSYRDATSFASKYGILERVEKNKIEGTEASSSIGKSTTSHLIKEKTGVSPKIFSDLLLQNAVFLSLEEVAEKLPDYQEEVIEVKMNEEQTSNYNVLEAKLQQATRDLLRRGDKGLLGTLVNTLLAYPDCCKKGEVVTNPRTKQVIHNALPLTTNVLPKEEKCLSLIQEEIQNNRKVILYLEHTGSRGLHLELEKMLASNGISFLTLLSHSPSASKREKWLKKQLKDKDFEVLICNPRLVETGLDLIEFPTIIYFQTGYSVFTVRQSSRRSWRIGQDKDVKVFFLSYANTMQERAINLISEKIQTSLAIEGKLSTEGLSVLAKSEMSILVELAETLMNNKKPNKVIKKKQTFQQNIFNEPKTETLKVQFNEELKDTTETQEEEVMKIMNESQEKTNKIELQDQQSIEPKTETKSKPILLLEHKNITKSHIFRGNIKKKDKYAIVDCGNNVFFIFQKGKILYNNKIVGGYDKKGIGKIGQKEIAITPNPFGYQLMEVVKQKQAS